MIGVNRRRVMGGGALDEIIMTDVTNPEVLAVCYAQGWASHSDYMTKREAESVTNIGQVFRNNTDITHFEELQYFTALTGGLTYSFANCTNLQTVTLPSQITVLDKTFTQAGLVTINNVINVTNVGIGAFYLCRQLQSIELGSGLTNIGDSAFEQCTNVTSFTVHAVTPPTVGGRGLLLLNKATFYVPAESVDLYKVANGFSSYSTKIQAIPT